MGAIGCVGKSRRNKSRSEAYFKSRSVVEFAMKPFRMIVFAAFALLVASAGALSPVAAADKVKLSLAATNDPAYLPFFVAIDKGLLQATRSRR